jgi:hypothetical protein
MMMRKSLIALLGVASMSMGACTTTNDDTLASAATGAGLGAAAGAGVGAVVGGISPIEGAIAGAAIGGLAGAVWADRDNDGRADGYYQNGQYYQGVPAGYDANASSRSCPSVAGSAVTGAAVGAAGGAGVGALVNGVSPLEGAIAGAAIGGIAGAVWADSNNDGCVDGYYRDGRYYQGTPTWQQPTPIRQGERG